MKKIIAIGGGEIGRPGFPVETTRIDKEIIRISGEKRPKLLFLPTASGDSESYAEVVKKHFGRRFGCRVETIFLLRKKNTFSEIRKKVLASDIIYVGGGDTLKMMRCWRELGVDKILREAYEKGIVLSGISAGAICWFSFGNSDSSTRIKKEGLMIKVRGIGLVKILFCPHYDVEKQRRPELKKMMKNTSGVAIAFENCTAIEILDDRFRIIRSKEVAHAYKVYWKNGRYFEKKIPVREKFVGLRTLLVKD